MLIFTHIINKKFMIKLNFIKQKNLTLPIVIIIAALIIGGAIYLNPKKTAGFLSAQEAGQKAIDFINQNIFSGQNVTASLIDITESNGLYKMKIAIEGEEIETYLSLDGKLLFPQFVTMETEEEATAGGQKSDYPDVKLFVMTHCPYGLQAQKALLPVYDLLKDEAEIGVYFVNYIMHGKIEIDENLRQYCIQRDQQDKYSAYFSCFAQAGDFNGCLSGAGIDMNQLNSCVSQTDQDFGISADYNDQSTWLNGIYPLFNVQTDLNTQYGVQGSPTLVINGKIANVNRSPEEFKKAVCNAFNTAPAECSQALSNETPSAGFGGGTGTSGGSCE